MRMFERRLNEAGRNAERVRTASSQSLYFNIINMGYRFLCQLGVTPLN